MGLMWTKSTLPEPDNSVNLNVREQSFLTAEDYAKRAVQAEFEKRRDARLFRDLDESLKDFVDRLEKDVKIFFVINGIVDYQRTTLPIKFAPIIENEDARVAIFNAIKAREPKVSAITVKTIDELSLIMVTVEFDPPLT